MSLIKSDAARAVWDGIDDLIEDVQIGKTADGGYCPLLAIEQRMYVKGLRSARLRAIKKINQHFPT